MKYKAIKSAAHNFGNPFASSLNWAANDYVMSHLARRALASGRTEMIVDLLTGEARPGELVGPPVQESIVARLRWFPSLLASQRIDPAAIRSARMRIAFDTSRCTAPAPYNGNFVREGPFDCRVEVVDDNERTHAAHFRRWWGFSTDAPALGMPRGVGRWQRLLNTVGRAGQWLLATSSTARKRRHGGR